MSLQGKTAIVVGGGGPNMGRATASLFSSRGVSVCVADVDCEGGEATVALVAGDGGEAIFVQTDLLDEASVEAMVAETVAHFGSVHFLCNFAAKYDPRVGVMEAETADFDRIVGVTLRGSWLTTKHAMKAMLANEAPGRHDLRGAIVFIASAVAHRGAPNYVAYTVAKSGVLGLTRAAALDGAPHGIRANCISPGVTRTPASPMPTMEDEVRAAAAGILPYVGEPEDMANAAVWLCSDEARFVTGTVLKVDGGMTVKL
jgi:NAD(P)-dependent dehydrogenase (short-subunit alcohol dehydrogenase family)